MIEAIMVIKGKLLLIILCLLIVGCSRVEPNQVVVTTPDTAITLILSATPLPTNTTFPSDAPTFTRIDTSTPNPSPTSVLTVIPTIAPTLLPTATPIADLMPFDKAKVLLSVLEFSYSYGTLKMTDSKLTFVVDNQVVVVYDLANPREPKEILRENMPGFVYGTELEKNLLYVWGESQIDVWDISTSPQPVLATAMIREAGQRFIPRQDMLYVFEEINEIGPVQLRVIDMVNPFSPQELGAVEWTGAIPNTLFPMGEVVYAFYDDRLEVVDIFNSETSSLLAAIELPGGVEIQTHFMGNHLFIFGQPNVWVFDVQNPSEPREISSYMSRWNANNMNVLDNWVYLTWQVCGWEPTEDGGVSGGCGQGIEIVDFMDITDPQHRGVLRLNMPSESIEKSYVTANTAYVITNSALYVLELTEEFLP